MSSTGNFIKQDWLSTAGRAEDIQSLNHSFLLLWASAWPDDLDIQMWPRNSD